MTDDLMGSIHDALRQARREQGAREQPEPEQIPQEVPHVVLYRLAQEPVASPFDFRSNLVKGLPRRPVEDQDPIIWAGLSMYDSPEQAESTARRYKGRPGRYLAEVHLPLEDLHVLIRQTLKPGHFTVLCSEELCLHSFSRVVRPIVSLSA